MTNIILYQTPQGNISIAVKFENDTFWLTQKAMAELFDTTKQNVSLHLQNIFKEGELDQNSVVKDFLTTAEDGKNYKTAFYNLDAVIAVGYRVNSKKATQFRIWATQTLKEYIIKGFVIDDERLKQGKQFGKDYFEELLARIRDIRASEKRFYQKIRDLFSLSADYEQDEKETPLFFATTQNKLLYAVTKHTAAEIILQRAKADLPNMGLTTWKGSKIRKEDIIIAKNYLTEDEIDTLNRMVTLFLDTAELRIKDENVLSLAFWKEEVDNIIKFSRKELLNNAGKVSNDRAEAFAKEQYRVFDHQRNKEEADAADRQDKDELDTFIQQTNNKTK